MVTSCYRCRVCGRYSSSKTYAVREMMFGTREIFEYQECECCKSLQIAEIPDPKTLSRYYPPNYYSYNLTDAELPNGIRQRVLRWAVRQRDKAALGSTNVLGGVLKAIKPPSGLTYVLSKARLRPHERILDVGCGAGALLDRLAGLGFTKLYGIDPFVSNDFRTKAGVGVRKLLLSEIQETFDVIMFHHSFEHVPWPEQELRSARKRLDVGGRCIIRIPTPSSEAWELFQTDWVQLDAPRHLVLISRPGMQALARNSGFHLSETIDDSTEFGFIGSKAYRRDIPLMEAQWTSLFSASELTAYTAKAQYLNSVHRGDQAAFVLEAV